MTDISPENVARMLNGVTDGPWKYCETLIHERKYGGGWVEGPYVEDDDGVLRSLLIPMTGSGGAMSYTTQLVDIQDHDHNDANARFIAWAREAVPALSARLAADAKAHEKEIAVWSENYTALERRLSEVQTMIAAAVMEAADAFDCDKNLSREICCNGQHCGCQGATAADYVVHQLRASIAPDAMAALEAYRDREVAKALEEALEANRKAREDVIHSGYILRIEGIREGHDRADAAIRAMIPQVKP